MARNIGTQAVINQARLKQQMSHPASPDSGYELLYIVSGSSHGGLFVKDSSGRQIGPFITGASSSSGWSLNMNEAGTSFTGWTAVNGTWSSDGTVIKQTNTAASTFRARFDTKIPITDVIYEAEIQLRSSGAARVGGLLVGFDGSTTTGNVDVIIDEGNNVVKIEVSGVATLISYSTTINVNTWYKIRVRSTGGFVTAWIDGTLIGTAGNNPSRSADSSYLGLMTFQAEVWFRNIKAWTVDLPA